MIKNIIFLILIASTLFAQRATMRTLAKEEADNMLYFGEMAFYDSSYALTLAANTWARVDNADSSLFSTGNDTSRGVTYGKDSLQIANPGFYHITYSLSCSVADTDTVYLCLGINSVEDSTHAVINSFNNGAPSNIETLSGSGVYWFSAANDVAMFIKSKLGSNATLYSGSVSAIRIKRKE